MPPTNREDLWASGKDETVEVNQRALIDKILARYSGEHTIFRELLQNADDAEAQHVQVKFYSQHGLDALERGQASTKLPDLKKEPMLRYVVSNDGRPFRPEDWQRLKKIAEGNPDEEKIGAFGVGFYSLWSVCDDPFVESASKWMGFYWKDGRDQLLARSGDLPPSTDTKSEPTSTGYPWTTFTMALRSPTPLEGALDFARFLITSLTFMKTMRKIDMLVDGIKVLEVEKGVKSRTTVGKRGMKNVSAGGMMTVQGVDATGMVITAKVMKWLSASGFTPPPLPPPVPTSSRPGKLANLFTSSFFRNTPVPTPEPIAPLPPIPPENPLEVTTLSREIQIYQADIKVTVSPAFGRELERATKKPPPQRMPASLVFSRGEEDEIADGARDVGAVFGGLCPSLDGEKSAKVFIGQATGQTTGIGGHLAARFIPTVERESIDLVDRHVSHWNKELLWVGGYLSRLIYELELLELQTIWKSSSVSDPATRARISGRALHALRFFTFKPTTPSLVVGQEMELAFFSCATDNASFPIISNAGILPVKEVHLPDETLLKFLPDLPVLTPSTLADAARFIARLRERSLIKNVTFDDVIKQLGARPLTEIEMIECLKWWQATAPADSYALNVRNRLLDAVILIKDDGKIIPLSTIQTIVKPQSSSIPTDMPLPPHTLPYSITKDLKGATIYANFGWTELSLLQYITFLIGSEMSGSKSEPDTDLRISPVFAEKVLSMLGRAWQSIAANQQTAIALELKDVACIPTKMGFKKPGESYFEKNLLFDDLPFISLPKNTAVKGGMEKMLLAIGVRKTVDLQLVFRRLVGDGKWNCTDLMKYLVSVRDTLTTEEMDRLKQTSAFPLEIEQAPDATEKPTPVRRKPRELYEPTDVFKSLGLPILDWGESKWKSNSDEARMLFTLGLRRSPPIDVLLGIASGKPPTSNRALQYLLANTLTHYPNFDPSAFSAVAFLPAITPSGTQILAKPGHVFTNPDCAILGFAVAQAPINTLESAGKLKIPANPPMERLVTALISNHPSDLAKAKRAYEYLASCLGQVTPGALDPLQNHAFIPVQADNSVRLVRPSAVYFAAKDGNQTLFKSFFTFVDFGEKANLFLRYCGVRSEPSVKDIATLLTKEPSRMLQQAGSPEKYLEQLRVLAANWNNMDSSTRTLMRISPFVLASQEVPSKRRKSRILSSLGAPEYDDHTEREWVLCKASEVAIIDDITMLQYFGNHILAAPEEHLLEEFYSNLGAKPLTSLIRTEYLPQGGPQTSERSQALRQRVLQRLTIYLAEARRRQSEYTADWLSKGDNFVVSEVQSLKARYTYNNGKTQHQHSETLYATASKGKNRSIILTISLSAQPDDYDIASALVNVLMKQARADDALLFHSILSTPLVALKKRGFNVDRMLNQQREERLRIQAEAMRDHEKASIQDRATRQNGTQYGGSEVDTVDDTIGESSQLTQSEPEKKNGARSLFEKLASRKSGGGGLGDTPSLREEFQNALKGMGGAAMSGGVSGGPSAGTSTKRPTDLSSIRNTVQQAISASRPDAGTTISESRKAVKNVSESQDDYCDATGVDAALDVAGMLNGGVKFWVAKGFPSEAERIKFVSQKTAICQTFATKIILPIARVFNLSPSVMNVFWDHEGPLIAFNRGGSLFCNGRYFAAWHEAQVMIGHRNDALISWYFSLAHELAHNLESAHNASHEFYFSSIAEEYLISFAKLLSSNSLVDID